MRVWNFDKAVYEEQAVQHVPHSDRCVEALNTIMHWTVDGEHHKQWLLDQVVRILCTTEERYEAWKRVCAGDPDDEENYYGEWDEGIAP